ncbi:endoglucanase 16-like [Silene latifolia]|uniref:endoglucanase 16-like n=1 Tax=Silene latifolia TaxID=37657 RepID=UPI003D78698D
MCTRPDISYALSMMIRYQNNPGDSELRVKGYTDANFQTDRDDMKCQAGFVFMINGGAICWRSFKESVVADSTTEAEYITASKAAEAVWIRQFFEGLRVVPIAEDPITIYCDNSGAIFQAKEHKSSNKSRHSPENMQTPCTVLKIVEHTPGFEIAAETAAAMAAGSIIFRDIDHVYSHNLLNKAKSLFSFAGSRRGTYDGECPFYCSYSGFNDEMQWAATWMYKATRNETYLHYITDESIDAVGGEFNWDLKYAGSQILLTEMFFQGQQKFVEYRTMVDSYICSVIPGSPYAQAHFTPGGMLYMRDGANSQYVTAASFAFSVYSDVLAQHNQRVICGGKQFAPTELLAFAKKRMDYILGSNPQQRSYMVGFGKNPPQQPHHRGASVPVLQKAEVVSCARSFVDWFTKNAPNPNELTGAIVGGPDRNYNFEDRRHIGNYEEPCTYVNSLAIGVLARLAMGS